MVVCGGVAVSSKGRGRGFFLRLGRFGRGFRRLGARGRLLEVQVLQGHVQGHDLNAAHGLEVSEARQRAVAVVLVLGGGGRGVLARQQCGEQQFRHEQAPVGPLGLARLPLHLRQPGFAQPGEGASEKYCQPVGAWSPEIFSVPHLLRRNWELWELWELCCVLGSAGPGLGLALLL